MTSLMNIFGESAEPAAKGANNKRRASNLDKNLILYYNSGLASKLGAWSFSQPDSLAQAKLLLRRILNLLS